MGRIHFGMVRSCSFAATVFAALAAGACAPRLRYQPVPLTQEAATAVFSERRLDEPSLQRFLLAHGVTPQEATWRSRDLGMVALFYSPELDTARASLAVARAAEITAGQRPQPSAGTTIGIPFTAGVSAGFPLETGGKRSARLSRARAATAAAELRVRAAAWRVALDAHETSIAALGADRDLTSARAERGALAALRSLLRARFAEGSISVADVARAEADLQSATIGVTQAERAQLDARDTLARALALPVETARAIRILPDSGGGTGAALGGGSDCGIVDSLDAPRLQSLALGRRSDLGAALADYVVAEADVRIEITRQFPDVNLGPGLAWDAGTLKWILSLALPNVALNRNRGPIAEAQARREAAAARIDLIQQQVIREVSAAGLECSGAREQLGAADLLAHTSQRQLALARAAYQRGETGRTEVAFAELSLVRATRTLRTSQQRFARAGVVLERSLGGWLTGPTVLDADILAAPQPSIQRK